MQLKVIGALKVKSYNLKKENIVDCFVGRIYFVIFCRKDFLSGLASDEQREHVRELE